MKIGNINPVSLIFFPALATLPVSIDFFQNVHIGGINIITEFLLAAFNPSFEATVIKSSFEGLKISILIAIISWIFTIIIGLALGLLSSIIFWNIFKKDKFFALTIKRFLSIPRSIHEVLWGLLLLQVLGLNLFVGIIAIVIPYSSIFSRVVANQLDNLNSRNIIATEQTGASSISCSLTNLTSPLISIFKTYGMYRLECSFRGSILLGVFGLGGIGTELKLTMQSLQFRELWTSLWMIAIVVFLIEKLTKYIQKTNISFNPKSGTFFISAYILFIFIAIITYSFKSIELNHLPTLNSEYLALPQLKDLSDAFRELPMISLIIYTITLTLLSAGIAIGMAPLLLIISSNPIYSLIQDFILLLCRIIPPPLTALLLILCNRPSISVAALALGIYNFGVLGKVLKENIYQQNKLLFKSLRSIGASSPISFIYGRLISQSRQYLAFSSTRLDVILRETTLVGVVGGIGLGWQLQESLSSFNWPQVTVVTLTFTLITLIGEYLSDKTQEYWMNSIANSSDLNFVQE